MSDEPSAGTSLLQRLSWQAVLFGFVVDYGGSTAFGFVAGVIGGIMQASHGASTEEATKALLTSAPFLKVMLTMGLLFVVMGGFVSARLAPRAPFLNAAALGVVDLVLGISALYEGLPAWYLAAAFSATMPCVLLGAAIARLFAGDGSHRPERPPDAEF